MSVISNKALGVASPVGSSAADATFAKGCMRESSSASPVTRAIPKAWLNRTVTFQSIGKYTQYCIVRKGDSAPTLALDQVSPLNAQSAAAAPTLPAGQSSREYIPGDAVSLCFISEATGGFFEGWLSDITHPKPAP